MACSLSFAYFLHDQNQNDATYPMVLPVLNTKRKELHLRSDVDALLQHYNITIDWLIFIEDVMFLKDSPQLLNKVQVVLVDHNYPSEECMWLVSNVVKVIDHHEKLPHEIPMDKCNDWLIEKVGSCSSLVVEEMLRMPTRQREDSSTSKENVQALDSTTPMNASSSSLHSNSSDYKIDPTSAALLIGAILVDTVCGSPAAARETPKDADALNILDATADLPYNQGRFFEWLMSAKFDISSRFISKEMLSLIG